MARALADNDTSVDSDYFNLRANSEAFFYKLDNIKLKVKNATKALLQDNEKYILCLETSESSMMSVLLASTLRKLKEDFSNQYSDLVFTDFHSFIKFNKQHQNENFPDILVCKVGIDEQLDQYPEILTSWARLVKEESKKIIFIMKNSNYLEQSLMKTRLVNVLKLKFTELWEEHDTFDDEKDKNEQAGLNKQINNEVKTMNVNKAKEESSESSSSHDAVKMIQALEILKLHGIDNSIINDVDAEGNTPLHLAAGKGQNKIVKALLDYDVPKDLLNTNGFTPLHLATSGGHLTVVSTMLENDANVNASDSEFCQTALHKACNINDVRLDLIKLLLRFGADIKSKTKRGNTALHLATGRGHNAAVTTLLEHGSNVNAQNNDGQSPLHFVVVYNKEEVVLELLRNGANVHLQDNQQKTALDYAQSYKIANLTQIIAKHVALAEKNISNNS